MATKDVHINKTRFECVRLAFQAASLNQAKQPERDRGG